MTSTHIAIFRGQRFPGSHGPCWTTRLSRAQSYGPHLQVISWPADLMPALVAATAAAAAEGHLQPVSGDLFIDETEHPEWTALVNAAQELTP